MPPEAFVMSCVTDLVAFWLSILQFRLAFLYPPPPCSHSCRWLFYPSAILSVLLDDTSKACCGPDALFYVLLFQVAGTTFTKLYLVSHWLHSIVIFLVLDFKNKLLLLQSSCICLCNACTCLLMLLLSCKWCHTDCTHLLDFKYKLYNCQNIWFTETPAQWLRYLYDIPGTFLCLVF